METSANSASTLSYFISELKVRVMDETIERALNQHPDNSSLFAISDVLNSLKIPNVSARVKGENLIDLPRPFIAVSNMEEFIVVTDINADQNKVEISSQGANKQSVEMEEFLGAYGGVVLVAEPDEESGEVDYAIKRRQKQINSLRIPAVITGAMCLLIIGVFLLTPYATTFSWQLAALTIFKFTGLTASILLLVHSIDANNPMIQKLCTGAKSNCNAILSSEAAIITSYFSWSEAGFFYFAGTLLVLLFNSASVSLMQMLAILSIATLPYTFYSIYYQAIKVKQWCVFCATIQALFWLEFFAFLPYLSQPFITPGIHEWGIVTICMAGPALLWIFIKPFMRKAAQLEPVFKQLNSFKYNPTVISAFFNAEDSYTLLDQENSIILGNPEAEHTVTFVSNPHCHPCADAHKLLDPWLDTRDDVKLQIVFYANTENNAVWQVANHLLTLRTERGEAYVQKAWADWFKQKHPNYSSWSKIYPVEREIVKHDEILAKQKSWCWAANIKGTPVIFINGRRLPNSYGPNDIKYFI